MNLREKRSPLTLDRFSTCTLTTSRRRTFRSQSTKPTGPQVHTYQCTRGAARLGPGVSHEPTCVTLPCARQKSPSLRSTDGRQCEGDASAPPFPPNLGVNYPRSNLCPDPSTQ